MTNKRFLLGLLVLLFSITLALTACPTDNDNDDDGDDLTTLTINGLPPNESSTSGHSGYSVTVFTNGTDISTSQAYYAAQSSHCFEASGNVNSGNVFTLFSYTRSEGNNHHLFVSGKWAKSGNFPVLLQRMGSPTQSGSSLCYC